MSTIRLDKNRIDEKISQLRSLAVQIENSTIEKSMASGGDCSSQIQLMHQELKAIDQKIDTLINATADFLGQAKQKYIETDEALSGAIEGQ